MITIVAGARPNYMKIAPIIRSIHNKQSLFSDMKYRIVHTGQHFDPCMSKDFFMQLDIPEPDINLACSTGSQAELTASIMVKFEKDLLAHNPKLVIVVGDVTSTMACAITAKKLNIDTVHVEAGIRSGDMSMPEEINRILTDSISDHYFTTSRFAGQNLLDAGIMHDRIHFVGNTMIDTLMYNVTRLRMPYFWLDSGLKIKNYVLLTLHRPINVDDPTKLHHLLSNIVRSSQDLPVVFSVHPRTKAIIEKSAIPVDNIIMVEPQPYLEFIFLVKNALGIITDSGGITEEATVLNIPCVTLRSTTERPETVTMGSNILVGEDMDRLAFLVNDMKSGIWKKSSIPELWDGHAADRIVDILQSIYYQN